MPNQTACLPHTKSIVWVDEAATQRFAQALAQQPALRYAFIELRGALGSGKTSLTRHLLRALGVQGHIKSPTYAVAECYQLANSTGQPEPAQLPIWHFDFYRFNDAQEWQDAGLRDIFANPGLKLVEWPDKALGQLPLADLVLDITVVDENARQVNLHAQSANGLALLAGLLNATHQCEAPA